jgi:hypothetical protein
MRPLSATEAISPAIERARTVLFNPFKPGRTWKLSITAYLSTLGMFYLPTSVFSFAAGASQPHKSMAALLLSAGLSAIISIVSFVFFIIGVRMEFVLFDIVLLNEKFVAPSWRRHVPHSWRWVGFKLLFSLAVSALCGPFLYFAYARLFPRIVIAHSAATPGQLPPHFFATLASIYLIIGIPFGLAMLISAVLTNFALPSVALDDTTVREALRRTFSLFSAEPGAVSLFIGLKAVLAIAAFLAMETVILIAEILCFIPIGLVALAGWFLFRSAGDIGHILMVVGAVILLIVFAVIAIYISTVAVGSVYVFFQAYALYFLGGRYPTLGNLLEPPYQPVTYAPPPPPLPIPIPPPQAAI